MKNLKKYLLLLIVILPSIALLFFISAQKSFGGNGEQYDSCKTDSDCKSSLVCSVLYKNCVVPTPTPTPVVCGAYPDIQSEYTSAKRPGCVWDQATGCKAVVAPTPEDKKPCAFWNYSGSAICNSVAYCKWDSRFSCIDKNQTYPPATLAIPDCGNDLTCTASTVNGACSAGQNKCLSSAFFSGSESVYDKSVVCCNSPAPTPTPFPCSTYTPSESGMTTEACTNHSPRCELKDGICTESVPTLTTPPSSGSSGSAPAASSLKWTAIQFCPAPTSTAIPAAACASKGGTCKTPSGQTGVCSFNETALPNVDCGYSNDIKNICCVPSSGPSVPAAPTPTPTQTSTQPPLPVSKTDLNSCLSNCSAGGDEAECNTSCYAQATGTPASPTATPIPITGATTAPIPSQTCQISGSCPSSFNVNLHGQCTCTLTDAGGVTSDYCTSINGIYCGATGHCWSVNPVPVCATAPTQTTTVAAVPTPTLAPTSPPVAGGTQLIFTSIKLDGITDLSIKKKTSNIYVRQVESDAILATGLMTYKPGSNGAFTGLVNLPAQFTPGYYTISTDNTLRKLIGFISPSANTTLSFEIALSLGDITSGTGPEFKPNNAIDISDYNTIKDCFGDKFASNACKVHPNNAAADLNGDGIISGIDYNIFLKNIGTRQGD